MNNWREKWSLIREFTTVWHGIQFRDKEKLFFFVKQEGRKLGFELPPSFREYIMFSADIGCNRENRFIKDNQKVKDSLLNYKNRLVIRDDYVIEYLNELSVISLLRQSEGDAFWGIKLENITQKDPPVENYTLNDIDHNSYEDYALSKTIREEDFSFSYTYAIVEKKIF